MRLHDDWKWILSKSWSVRFIAIAALLSGLEVTINVIVSFNIWTPIPPGVFAALAGLVTVAAFIARIVAQDHSK